MIICLLFDCAKTASMSALSRSVSANVKTVLLSSVLSLNPSRAPAEIDTSASAWNLYFSKWHRTYNDSANEGMLEHPARGDVCDADFVVAVSDVAQDSEQSLEEVPGAPGLQNHIEILSHMHSSV